MGLLMSDTMLIDPMLDARLLLLESLSAWSDATDSPRDANDYAEVEPFA